MTEHIMLKYPFKSGVFLQEGDIAQLTTENGQIVFTKSDGSCPIGIVQSVGIGFSQHAYVSYERTIHYSLEYDEREQYSVNAPLFVSLNGKFTTRRAKPEYPSIGIVIEPPSDKAMLKLLWL